MLMLFKTKTESMNKSDKFCKLTFCILYIDRYPIRSWGLHVIIDSSPFHSMVNPWSFSSDLPISVWSSPCRQKSLWRYFPVLFCTHSSTEIKKVLAMQCTRASEFVVYNTWSIFPPNCQSSTPSLELKRRFAKDSS